MWRLSHGWIKHGLTRNASARPTYITTSVYHSFEAAIKVYPTYSWFEITDPEGNVVLSSYGGLDRSKIPHLSLCARQILGYPDAIAETDYPLDQASSDDGVSWSPVLLGVKATAGSYTDALPRTPFTSSALSSLTISRDSNSSDKVLINYRSPSGISGRMSILSAALEIRETSSGRYDLHILSDASGASKGVYSKGLAPETVDVARELGIRVRDNPKQQGAQQSLSRRLVKTWKPGLIDLGSKVIRGVIRGDLGIDRRLLDYEGYGGYTYQRKGWCLTHLPTKLYITSHDSRKGIEELADRLRDTVPELTDGSITDISQDIKTRARAVIDG